MSHKTRMDLPLPLGHRPKATVQGNVDSKTPNLQGSVADLTNNFTFKGYELSHHLLTQTRNLFVVPVSDLRYFLILIF